MNYLMLRMSFCLYLLVRLLPFCEYLFTLESSLLKKNRRMSAITSAAVTAKARIIAVIESWGQLLRPKLGKTIKPPNCWVARISFTLVI